MPGHWKKLLSLAQPEVERTLAALPKRLQAEARKLPVTYEPRPSRTLIAEGLDADLLGLFIGDDWADSEGGYSPLPSQVILFLDNLWDFAEGDEKVFREEVRTTLLHELGHYLGLDEDDLEERGLD